MFGPLPVESLPIMWLDSKGGGAVGLATDGGGVYRGRS